MALIKVGDAMIDPRYVAAISAAPSIRGGCCVFLTTGQIVNVAASIDVVAMAIRAETVYK